MLGGFTIGSMSQCFAPYETEVILVAALHSERLVFSEDKRSNGAGVSKPLKPAESLEGERKREDRTLGSCRWGAVYVVLDTT